MDKLLVAVLPRQRGASPVIDATYRFIGRGGTWDPDRPLMRKIEAAAMGQLSCARARVVR